MTFAIRLLLFFYLLSACSIDAMASDKSLPELRKAFLQAEQYIQQHRDHDYFAVADALKDYVLYPYLSYQWLSEHLEDEVSIRQFLHDFAESRYAPLLNEKWLGYLGKTQNWQVFLSQYHGSDDFEMQCFFASALQHLGQQQSANEAARNLWLTGKSLPANCELLFSSMKQSFYGDRELLWQRFQNALEQGNNRLAEDMLTKLPEAEQKNARLWLALHRQPQTVVDKADWKRSYEQAGLLFVHAIKRWLETDPSAALQTWDAEKNDYSIATGIVADIEKRLALALAVRHDNRAYARLASLADKDDSTREWRVRAALYEQNWPQVIDAVTDLDQDQRREEKWQYWQARALVQIGQTEQAKVLYQSVSKDRSVYGFLATERIQQPISLINQPILVSGQELESLQQHDDFLVVKEFLALERKIEAKRQWRYAIAKLKDRELVAAAKLAQYWQLPALAISTIAKASVWDDLELRFPLQYADSVQRIAMTGNFNPAVIMGLIRQESVFDETAGSSAGAKGLMQLMPTTAKEVAVESKLAWGGESTLYDPQINIQYGSAYYQKLLKRFNGHYLPATAAYNAGPNRVRQWLPQNKAIPGDIWMETIPYKETRGYVAAVMTNSIVYQQRLGRNGPAAMDLLRDVMPG